VSCQTDDEPMHGWVVPRSLERGSNWNQNEVGEYIPNAGSSKADSLHEQFEGHAEDKERRIVAMSNTWAGIAKDVG
jgi:hypothetical protein